MVFGAEADAGRSGAAGIDGAAGENLGRDAIFAVGGELEEGGVVERCRGKAGIEGGESTQQPKEIYHEGTKTRRYEEKDKSV